VSEKRDFGPAGDPVPAGGGSSPNVVFIMYQDVGFGASSGTAMGIASSR